MGICTISSYRGSELFEIIGLNEELIRSSFSYSKVRTSGIGLKELEENLNEYDEVDDSLDKQGRLYNKVDELIEILKTTNLIKNGN